MIAEPISDIQRKIYKFIVDFITTEGMPPTNREIGAGVGIPSTGHIDHHLKMLEKHGWIIREARKSRGIKLIKRPDGIPVIGTIAAGVPLDVFLNGAYELPFHHPFVQEDDIYALKVKGHSMIEDAICDGDYVLIKPQSICHNGDIVVAIHLQEGISGSATLKRFFQEPDGVRLQPANSEMKPILIPKQGWDREWKIQGKVIAILRQYHFSPLL